MATLFDTTDLERSLLKLMMTQLTVVKLHIHSVKSDWLTSGERKRIFNVMRQYFEGAGSLLTKKLFAYELGKTEKKHKSYFVTEWNMIAGVEVSETPEALMDLLNQAYLGRESMKICERVINSLEGGDVHAAIDTLRSESVVLGTDFGENPTVSLADFARRKQVLLDKIAHPEKYKGKEIGFRTFDRWTGGLFPCEMTLVAAVTGVGKSTFMKMVEYNLVRNGCNCLHITNEESREQVEMKFDALMSSVDYLKFKRVGSIKDPRTGEEERVGIDESELASWENIISTVGTGSCGNVYIKEVPQWATAYDVERAFVELQEQGIRIDLVVIDYMDMMAPVQKAWGENDEQAKVAADVKGLAVTLNVPVLTATQAATIVEQKTEKGQSFGKLDVYGSKRKIHNANTFMGILAVDEYRNEVTGRLETVDWEVFVKKNRDGPPFVFRLRQYVQTGLVEEIEAGTYAKSPEKLKTVGIDAEDKDAGTDKVEASDDESTTETDEPVETIPDEGVDEAPSAKGGMGTALEILSRVEDSKRKAPRPASIKASIEKGKKKAGK